MTKYRDDEEAAEAAAERQAEREGNQQAVWFWRWKRRCAERGLPIPTWNEWASAGMPTPDDDGYEN